LKAVVQERYGGPEVLAIRDLAEPEVGDDEVLVRVMAASLHIGDVFGTGARPCLFGS
jgi:NADPH:quinone reductase-like Zn-dependent oxidoreductase